MQGLISFLFATLVAVALAACSGQTQDLGAGTNGELPEDSACSCSVGGSCCATDLICDECGWKGGLQTECSVGRTFCRARRPADAPCTMSLQCKEGLSCAEVGSGGAMRCTAPGGGQLPAGRCRESLDCPDNSVCVDSNCKLGRGAYCSKSSECASNVCYVVEGCR